MTFEIGFTPLKICLQSYKANLLAQYELILDILDCNMISDTEMYDISRRADEIDDDYKGLLREYDRRKRQEQLKNTD